MQGLHDGNRFAMSVEDLERPYAQFLLDVIRMNVQEYSREQWQLWQEEAQVHNLPLLAYRVEHGGAAARAEQLRIELWLPRQVAEEKC